MHRYFKPAFNNENIQFCILKLFLHIIVQTILDLSLPLIRSVPCFLPTTWTAGKPSCFLHSLRLATEWYRMLFMEHLPFALHTSEILLTRVQVNAK